MKRKSKNTRKATSMNKPGDKSNYAKKRQYLLSASRNAGRRVYGFEINPKPWK
ncbi:MAG: hypothetical protein GY757_53685 [bacterium]|nr:hypothetical protein [bacterium]